MDNAYISSSFIVILFNFDKLEPGRSSMVAAHDVSIPDAERDDCRDTYGSEYMQAQQEPGLCKNAFHRDSWTINSYQTRVRGPS